MNPTQVLFVCMANICRSPMAEAVMRKLVKDSGMCESFVIESAGTHDYHLGEAPDPRAQASARRRGYDLSGLRARQIVPEDFERFDHILAMDFNNLAALDAMCPQEHKVKMKLLMPYATNRRATIVHDPYYRSARDFDLVLDCIEDACKGLLHALTESEEALPAAHWQSHTRLNVHSNTWAFPLRLFGFRA